MSIVRQKAEMLKSCRESGASAWMPTKKYQQINFIILGIVVLSHRISSADPNQGAYRLPEKQPSKGTRG